MVSRAQLPPPDIRGNPILRRIWDNVHLRKMNQIILTNGLPRTGKSELNLSLAYILDRGSPPKYKRRFNIDKVKFTYKEYIKAVKDHNFAGECLIWEEAGTQEGANARKFFSDANISASSLFQTLGFKRQIALINLPCKIMLDKHVRLLVHAIIDTKNVDFNDKICRAKFYWSRYNANYDKQFRQFHVDIDKDGSVCRLDEIEVPRAPQELIDEYNKLEFIFKRKLQDTLANQAEVAEDKGITKENEAANVFEKVKENVSKYWNSKTSKPNVFLIVADFNISVQRAYSVSALMKEAVKCGSLKI